MPSTKKDNKQMMWIILAILIVIVIGVIIYFIVRNKSETYIKTYEEEFEEDENEDENEEENKEESKEKYEINELLTSDFVFHTMENYMTESYEIEMINKNSDNKNDPKKFVAESLHKLANLGLSLKDRFDDGSLRSLEEVKNIGHKYGVTKEFLEHLISNLKKVGTSFLNKDTHEYIHKNKEQIRRLLKVCCHELSDDVLDHLNGNVHSQNTQIKIEHYEEQVQENKKIMDKFLDENRSERRRLLKLVQQDLKKHEKIIRELKDVLNQVKDEKNIEQNTKVKGLVKRAGASFQTLKKIISSNNVERFISGEITFETYEPENFIENYRFSLKKAFKKVKGGLEKAGKAIKKGVEKVGSEIKKGAEAAINKIKSLGGDAMKLVKKYAVDILNKVLGKYMHIDEKAKTVTIMVTKLGEIILSMITPIIMAVPIVGQVTAAALKAGAWAIIFAKEIVPIINTQVISKIPLPKLPDGEKFKVLLKASGGPLVAILKKFGVNLEGYDDDFEEYVTEFLLKEHLKKVIKVAKDKENEIQNPEDEIEKIENEKYENNENTIKSVDDKEDISENVEKLLKHNFPEHEEYKEFKKILGKHINNKEIIDIIQKICNGGKKYSDAIHLLAIMHK